MSRLMRARGGKAANRSVRQKCRRCRKPLGGTKPVCFTCQQKLGSAVSYLFDDVLGRGS